MLSRKDSTQKYISIKPKKGIKEQKQKKYDNNITIIIYNEIKLHSELNISNLTCGKHLFTKCTHGMPEWPFSATCLGILVKEDFIGI